MDAGAPSSCIVDLLFSWIDKNLRDGFAWERPVRGGGIHHGIGPGAPERVRAVVVRGNETGLGDPVHRFQLLRGDERLRTRK